MSACVRFRSLALVAIMLVSAAAVAVPAVAAGSTAVSTTPGSQTIDAGTTTTFDVQLEDASRGVGSYDLRIESSNVSIAEITDVTLQGAPATQNVNISSDGSSADVLASIADTPDSGTVTMVTVTVRGGASGTADLSVTTESAGDEAGNPYTITDSTGASVTVRESTRIESLTVSPDSVDESATANQSVSFDVLGLSADGNTDELAVRFPSDVAVDAGGATVDVTDASGSSVSVTSSPTLEETSDNRSAVRFAVSPDSSVDVSRVTVDATVPVTYPSVGSNTTGTITAEADDSTGESATATTSVQIQNSQDGSGGGGGGDDAATVALEPAQQNVSAGGTVTYEVVMDSVSGGVGSYEFVVESAGPSVATITDVGLRGSPATQSVTFASDNSSVDVTAAIADTADSGTVTLMTVTVRGISAGSVDLDLRAPNAPGDEAGNAYTLSSVSGASVAVQAGPGDLTGNGDAATDPDDDGVYEDVNGDGVVTTADVTPLFNIFIDGGIQNGAQLDINGEGDGLTSADVTALFGAVLNDRVP